MATGIMISGETFKVYEMDLICTLNSKWEKKILKDGLVCFIDSTRNCRNKFAEILCTALKKDSDAVAWNQFINSNVIFAREGEKTLRAEDGDLFVNILHDALPHTRKIA